MKKDIIRIGEATMSEDAVKQLAGSVALECFGIVGMAAINVKDGLMRLITRESLTKGVEISMEDGGISVSFHVIVAYGVSIMAVSQNLVENITYKLEEYTGMKVRRVDVFVEGVKPID